MAEEQASVLAKLSDTTAALARLTAALEQRQSAEQSKMFDYVIQANGTTTVSLPKGTGGLFVYPQQDLSPVTVDVEGLKFKFPVGTTKGVFLPCPGTAAQAAFTNTSSSAIYCRIRTLSPEYAMMFAAGIANQGQVEIIDASGNVIGSSDTAGASILAQLTAGTAAIGVVTPAFSNGSQWQPASAPATSGASGSTIGPVATWLYNGSAFDTMQNNSEGTLLASAARTTSPSIPIQTNYNARGAIIFLNVTAASGTGGLTPQFFITDPVTNGTYGYSLSPSAITATGEYIFVIYPGASSTNVSSLVKQVVSIQLPRQWSVSVGIGDASSYTYSLGYSLIL